MDSILVVDDELSIREFLQIMLTAEKYSVDTAENGEQAIKKIDVRPYDLVICDIMMPRVNGMEVLRHTRELNPQTMVIMITAYASTETAVEAMKLGAYDYITKPFQVDEIKLIVRNALERARLLRENLQLKKELKTKYGFENLVGVSAPMLAVYDLIRQIAPGKSNVLISGESGTGKELVARAMHLQSPRRDKAFITVNCGAIPRELLESELFGHKKGAFTGAYQHKKGLFAVADQGTIFLDEISEIPTEVQVKLLRAIETKTFKPVGGVEDVSVDVRVIAATNRDIEAGVKEGAFREDLYYRLNVIRIHLPPLRDRKEDIPILAKHFLELYNKEIGRNIKKISREAEALLSSHNYPGNVRELENIIERAVSLEKGEVLLPESIGDKIKPPSPQWNGGMLPELPPEGINIESLLENIERRFILEALRRSGGVKKDAAKLLGLSFRSFRYRLDKLGI